MRKPAVFLDRDGVLTREKSYVLRREDLEIFPYVEECIAQIHQKGYWAIVITNQSAVGRGMLAESELLKMNEMLYARIGVDGIFYCPHWDVEGTFCNCRKPRTGLIEKAMEEFDIDLEESFFVGDRASDIETGKNMGIRTVLLESGYGSGRLEKEIEADLVLSDLQEFVRDNLKPAKILQESYKVLEKESDIKYVKNEIPVKVKKL